MVFVACDLRKRHCGEGGESDGSLVGHCTAVWTLRGSETPGTPAEGPGKLYPLADLAVVPGPHSLSVTGDLPSRCVER